MYIQETYKFNFLSPSFLLVGSIFAVYSKILPAGISFLLGLVFLISYHGIRIDPTNKKMQKFNRILWIRFGEWSTIQPIQYLTINRYNIRGSQAAYLAGSERGSTVSKSYKVNMVYEGKNLYVTILKGNKEKMITEALKLGKVLNCRVLDYSSHEKKWLYDPQNG